MKRFLPILLFALGLLFFAPPAWAATVRGCEVQGPADPDTGGTSYVCNPGVKVSGFTCMVANTQQAPVYWQNDTTGQTGTPPTQSSIPSGCAPADVFLSGGASRYWVAPNLVDTARDVVTSAMTSEVNGSAYNAWSMRTSFNNIVLDITGIDPSAGGTGVAINRGGAIGFFTGSIGSMATVPPASSIDYGRYMASKLQVPGTKPAYAATGGTGYNSLQPILFIWSTARNLAYLFFAIAFIVVGVQIMLGTKVSDGKTALSIQMALPRIIIAFLLVTFSYAIAGFIIDLMYVVIQLIFAITRPMFVVQSNLSSYEALRDSALGGENLFFFLLRGFPYQVENFKVFFLAIQTITDSLLGSSAISSLIGVGAGGVVTLVIAVAFLYTLFKIWLKLIIAYVQIILTVIAGPLLIMMDALPGNKQFEGYIRNLIANALMFPTVIGMTFLSVLITTNFGQGTGATNGFVAPLIGNTGGPLVLQSLLGMGILLSIPGMLDKIPGMLKAPAMDFGKLWADPVKNNYLSQMSAAIGKQKSDNFNKSVVENAIPEVKHPGAAPVAPPDWVYRLANTNLPAGASQDLINRQAMAIRAMRNHRNDYASWEGKVAKYNEAKGKLGYRAQEAASKGVAKVATLPGVGIAGSAAASAGK